MSESDTDRVITQCPDCAAPLTGASCPACGWTGLEHIARLARNVLAVADFIEALVIPDPPHGARAVKEAWAALVARCPEGVSVADWLGYWIMFVGIPLRYHPAEVRRFVEDMRADALLALAMPERAMEEPEA